jgi:hypothetical protein
LIHIRLSLVITGLRKKGAKNFSFVFLSVPHASFILMLIVILALGKPAKINFFGVTDFDPL